MQTNGSLTSDDPTVALVRPGVVIADRYLLLQLLGTGGFGAVYLAQHVNISTMLCAVKLLHQDRASDEDVVRRFRREAEALAALKSRYCLRVVDFGVAHDIPFLVTEFVENVPLDVLLEREGTLRVEDVARFSKHVLRALAEAHDAGIVHRDLKPSNVLVVQDHGDKHPSARVLDFGIAKVLASDDSPSPVSATETAGGLLLCTPAYASPEVLRGQASAASDLYSLGHMMAELLDGQVPYPGTNGLLVATSHLGADPVPLGPKASRSLLAGVIAKACEKDERRRYATAVEMLEDIDRAMSGSHSGHPLAISTSIQLRLSDVEFANSSQVRDARKNRNLSETVAYATTDSGIDAVPNHRRQTARETLEEPLETDEFAASRAPMIAAAATMAVLVLAVFGLLRACVTPSDTVAPDVSDLSADSAILDDAGAGDTSLDASASALADSGVTGDTRVPEGSGAAADAGLDSGNGSNLAASGDTDSSEPPEPGSGPAPRDERRSVAEEEPQDPGPTRVDGRQPTVEVAEANDGAEGDGTEDGEGHAEAVVDEQPAPSAPVQRRPREVEQDPDPEPSGGLGLGRPRTR